MKKRVVKVMVSGTKWTFNRVEELRVRSGILTVRYNATSEMRFPLSSVLWWDSAYETEK